MMGFDINKKIIFYQTKAEIPAPTLIIVPLTEEPPPSALYESLWNVTPKSTATALEP